MAATLRELRGRIRSAGSIKKITKAQELIATSRFQRALKRATEAEAYTRKIAELAADLGRSAVTTTDRARCDGTSSWTPATWPS